MSPRSANRNALVPLVFTVLASTQAMADDRPFHVEADVGRVSVDDFEGIPLNESTTAFRLGTGYHFLRWLGVAGAYVDLGTIETSVDTGAGPAVPLEASADGFEVTLVGRVPLTEALALTAQAGILWWTGDTSIGGTVSSDNGNDSTWGIGAEYAFDPRFTVTGGWRRYSIDNVDADAAWLGLMIRFGDAPQ